MRSTLSLSRSIAIAVLLFGALPVLAQETEPVNLDAAITLLRTDMRAQKPVILRAWNNFRRLLRRELLHAGFERVH